MKFLIQRYNPETDEKPYMQAYELDQPETGAMLLDALLALKTQDPGLAFRRSCGEGVCGSDGMNINGKNGLACLTPLDSLKQPIEIRSLPGQPIIRDLVINQEPFFKQYKAAKPWLTTHDSDPDRERLQSPEERAHLDGLYECILCACCSTACPSFWWNPDKFLGPAALLQACRFIEDSRDQDTEQRLDTLNDAYKLYRCHSIMNCVDVCPKNLSPTKAIGTIRKRMLQHSI
ncbi:MAG: succinate dehydrogenase iron-sulfur subunit [Gammaproteobacteria bacterium]